METAKMKSGLVILSLAILAGGYLTLWLSYPLLLNRLGGFNLASFSLILLFALLVLLPSIYTFRYAKRKPIRRWHIDVGLTYALLMAVIILAFAFDSLLPPSVPTFWRYFILPLAIVVTVFYLLRTIPRVRAKLDELSQDQ